MEIWSVGIVLSYIVFYFHELRIYFYLSIFGDYPNREEELFTYYATYNNIRRTYKNYAKLYFRYESSNSDAIVCAINMI